MSRISAYQFSLTDDSLRAATQGELPEALIELERRRLIERIAPPLGPTGPTGNLFAAAFAARPPADGASPLAQRRRQIRLQFLRQIGAFGADMARRIDACNSEGELDELMPQVDALVEALAGRDALDEFRQHAARRN